MKFENILIFSALLLASCSAFFSIVGIVGLFSSAAVSVGIMAGSIELAKLCSTTFIYRYWNKVKWTMKSYLLISIMILIMITSMGIYGYLSSAYTNSSSGVKADKNKIVMAETQRDYLTNRISQSKLRIDTLNNVRQLQENRLSSALTNDFLTRNPIQLRLLQEQTTDLIKSSDDNIKTEQDKMQSTMTDIDTINNKIFDINNLSNSKKDIQTFQFVADQLGVSLDTIARWFIFIIVVIFDPLAVVLLLAYNVTITSNVTLLKKETLPLMDNIEPTLPNIPPTSLENSLAPVIQPEPIEIENIIQPTPTEQSPVYNTTPPYLGAVPITKIKS